MYAANRLDAEGRTGIAPRVVCSGAKPAEHQRVIRLPSANTNARHAPFSRGF